MRRDTSLRLFERAVRVIPGGVNSPARAFRAVGGDPPFIERGQGSHTFDVDGNEYIDYVCSWGPLILGHAAARLVREAKEAVDRGSSFGAATRMEVEFAEALADAVPSIDMVRLVTSGTEAVMSAVRLARGFTGRDAIVKMAGCYHGHSDSLLVAAGSGLAESGRPSSAGVPQALAALTVVLPYNDPAAVERAFDLHPGRIAAVLVEPVAANMGVVPPAPGYLAALRQLCNRQGAVLIFDEVITGFRIALGGAQERYGIQADLTCLGKIVGGGLPCAAVGGRAEIMDRLAPAGSVYQAGTLSGNPLATAAANVTMDLLRQCDPYPRLERVGAALEQGLLQAAREAGVPVTVNRVGSILSCFFTDRPVRDFQDVQATDVPRFKRFFASMLSQGVYLAPSAFEAMFLSLSHTDQDIAHTIAAAAKAFRS